MVSKRTRNEVIGGECSISVEEKRRCREGCHDGDEQSQWYCRTFLFVLWAFPMIGLALGGVGVGSVEDGCETTRASEFGRGKTRLLSYFFSVADDWEMREMRFLRVSE